MSSLLAEADAEAADAKAAFARREYESAAVGFGRAIELHEQQGSSTAALHLLHCNHAASLAALGFHEAALAAARRSIAIGGDSFVKGHYRAALALVELERWEEAAQACEAALAITPESAQLLALIEKCRRGAVQRTEAELLRAALPQEQPSADALSPSVQSGASALSAPVLVPTAEMAAAAAAALESDWAAAQERTRAARDQRTNRAKTERERLETELRRRQEELNAESARRRQDATRAALEKDPGTQRRAPDIKRTVPSAESSIAAAAATERAQAVTRVNAWRAKEMPTRLPLTAPNMSSDFTKQFVLLKHDSARLFEYVRLIEPERCKAVFSPEIAPEVLQAIAVAIMQHASHETLEWAAAWLEGITQVPRFEMSVMMIDAPIARTLGRMFDALDALVGPDTGGTARDSISASRLTNLRAKFKS